MRSLMLTCFATYTFLLLIEFVFRKCKGVRKLWASFRILAGFVGLSALAGLATEWTGFYVFEFFHGISPKYLASVPNASPATHSLNLGTLHYQPSSPRNKTIPQDLASNFLTVRHSNIYRYIHHYSSFYGIDPLLVRAIIKVESAFDPMAISQKGAKGLMQINKITARHLGVKNPFNIRENIEGGTRYLKILLKKYYWDLHLALASYNAGPGTVERYKGIPPFRETQRYVWRVLEEYRRLKHLAEAFRKTRLRSKHPGKVALPTWHRALKPTRAHVPAAS